MPQGGWLLSAGRWAIGASLLMGASCQTPSRQVSGDGSLASVRAHAIAAARLAQDVTENKVPTTAPARAVAPSEIPSPQTIKSIRDQIPDPGGELKFLEHELARDLAMPVPDRSPEFIRSEYGRRRQDIETQIQPMLRSNRVEITLKDVIYRTIRNNYAIQAVSYEPAVQTTKVVEAESQFDAVYFASFNSNKQNRSSSSLLESTDSDVRTFNSGVRKLLSTGAQAQVSYGLTRTATNLSYQTLNPSYFNNFTVEIQQPFLRGFGLDYNRSQIELAVLDRQVSIEKMKGDIRDTIFNAYQAYWKLAQARRQLTISARLKTELNTILNYYEQRKKIGYDVFPVQISLVRSRIELRDAELIRVRNEIRNAEDAVKGLMNDPDLNLAVDVEIVPTETMASEPLIIDQIGEVASALSHRSELRQARLAIEQAQIAIGAAKNQALPKLNLLFRYIVSGLGSNPDQSFDQLSKNDFHDYVVGLEFEWPIGNRGPEAAVRRARLQQAQAIATHRARIEQVILEVDQAIRDLHSSFDQIGPSLRSALAAEDQLVATRIRRERLDPASLQVELDANESLANARQQVLQNIVNYNIALSKLEKQKGTLLEYNNIVIRGEDDDRYLQPYRPVGP